MMKPKEQKNNRNHDCKKSLTKSQSDVTHSHSRLYVPRASLVCTVVMAALDGVA